MTNIETSYAVLKYRHDFAAGEVLNFGVVLYSYETGQVGVLTSSKYGRLSETFAGFDGEQYKRLTLRLQMALEKIGRSLGEGLFQLEERQKYPDAGVLLRTVWPDQGLGYFTGSILHGITDNFESELNDLYDRFVLSQQDSRDVSARMDDAALWSNLRKVLSPRGITSVLVPKTLGLAEVEFEHAYKNHRWHVIEAVSFDYTHPGDIKQKALLTYGKASAIRDVEELGSFTVVVGRPRRIEADKSYRDAMRLLSDLPIPHRVVEEEDAEKFAVELEKQMRDQGVLPPLEEAVSLKKRSV